MSNYKIINTFLHLIFSNYLKTSNYINDYYFNSQFIYPGPGKPLDIRQVDGQYEAFTAVEKTTKHHLASLLTSEISSIITESLLAGAIAMALCYIARLQRTKPPGAEVSYLKFYCNLFMSGDF